jgi:hypothetical protein
VRTVIVPCGEALFADTRHLSASAHRWIQVKWWQQEYVCACPCHSGEIIGKVLEALGEEGFYKVDDDVLEGALLDAMPD